MLCVLFLFCLGVGVLCFSADRFVSLCIALSRRCSIAIDAVGATLVSFATTLPETLVSFTALVKGFSDVGLGNAFGSIIVNTALIAGISLLISPAKKIDEKTFFWRGWFFFGVLGFLLVVGFLFGSYSPFVGAVLLGGLALYASLSFRKDGIHSSFYAKKEQRKGDGEMVWSHLIVKVILMGALMFLGAQLTIYNGIALSRFLGVDDRVVAVTLIALGTSLPELVTTIVSLYKKSPRLGLGNIVGANILNLVLVLALPAFFVGIRPVTGLNLADGIFAFIVMAIFFIPALCKKRFYRWQGVLLLMLYGGYTLFLF